MTDKNLTDNEIVKALEDIIKHLDFTQIKSGENVLVNALDLISRQKAELEKSKALNKEIMQTVAGIRELAIREFVEDLITKVYIDDNLNFCVTLCDIVEILDEMRV